jgi:hypothetical protein
MLARSRTTAHDHKTSRRNPLGRYAPKRINEHSRWRFLRKHRAESIRRIGGPPDERQALAIDMLAKSEWTLFVAEHDAAAAPSARARGEALRVANDARKQVLLWNRELTAATSRPAAAVEPAPSLQDVVAGIVARRRAQPDEDAA